MKTKQESKSARVALRGAILTTHWQSFFILLIRTFLHFVSFSIVIFVSRI